MGIAFGPDFGAPRTPRHFCFCVAAQRTPSLPAASHRPRNLNISLAKPIQLVPELSVAASSLCFQCFLLVRVACYVCASPGRGCAERVFRRDIALPRWLTFFFFFFSVFSFFAQTLP